MSLNRELETLKQEIAELKEKLNKKEQLLHALYKKQVSTYSS